jgi:membrane AbrB-like protein
MVRLAAAALPAALGGWLAETAGVPLAWLVGAMLVTAALTLAGVSVEMPRSFYRAGQLTVAVAVGLTVSAEVARVIAPHLPVLLLGALASIGIGRLLAEPLCRAGGLDRGTAHFAMVPAGISEMGDLAGRRGGDVGAVATFHTVRVMVVVLVLPVLMLALFGRGAAPAATSPGAFDAALLAALAAGVAAAVVAGRIGMPAAWFVAPMIAVAVLSGAGLIEGRAPGLLLAVAQVALGLALGARFRRDTVARLPRALGIGIPLMAVHGVAMAALAWAAATAAGFDLRSVLLGLATGGTAEMVLTAKIVGADAALVAAYQVTRGLLGNLLADPLYRLTVAVRPEKVDP